MCRICSDYSQADFLTDKKRTTSSLSLDWIIPLPSACALWCSSGFAIHRLLNQRNLPIFLLDFPLCFRELNQLTEGWKKCQSQQKVSTRGAQSGAGTCLCFSRRVWVILWAHCCRRFRSPRAQAAVFWMSGQRSSWQPVWTAEETCFAETCFNISHLRWPGRCLEQFEIILPITSSKMFPFFTDGKKF